jgi:hypothetical protein
MVQAHKAWLGVDASDVPAQFEALLGNRRTHRLVYVMSGSSLDVEVGGSIDSNVN